MSRHERIIPSLMLFVEKIAEAARKEYPNGVPDGVMRNRIAQALRADPSLMDADQIAVGIYDRFRERHNAAVNRSDSFYLPSAWIKPARGVIKRMDRILLPDLDSWDAMNLAAQERINRTMDRKHAFIESRRNAMARYPEFPTLGEIQTKIFGYVEDPVKTATTFAEAADEASDE